MEALDRLWVGADDVDKALVDLHFEGFTASFVNVWRLHNGESAALGWKRDWTANLGASSNRSIHDLARALINHAMIIGFKANANS